MNLWGRLFAFFYDRFMAGTEKAGLADRRRDLLSDVTGSVVELGAGTGLNLRHYPRTGIEELVLVEPEAPMAERLERRVADSPLPARVLRAPGEEIPLPDHHFDVAVCTLVLCTVKDPGRTLAELRRVLKPDGRLLFLEHVRAEDPRLAKWQDRLNPVWKRWAHGCNCNRSTLDHLDAAGFQLTAVTHAPIPKAPPFVRPMAVGSAGLR